MVLKADINSCEIIDWQTNTGEYNVRNLQVELCEEMNQCVMAFVTFELADGTVYESLVKDGKAEIPSFKKPQFVKIGAYSADIEGGKLTKRYSPTPCYDYVNPGSYSGSGEEPPVPTPGGYANLLEQIEYLKKGTIKEVDEVNLSTCESGVYLTATIIYKTLVPQPIEERVPGKALLTVEKTQFGIHFFWLSDAYLIAGMSNENGRFESDFVKYPIENINNAVMKSDIITDGVIIDKTYSDEQVYNANSIKTAFEEIRNILEDLTDNENNGGSTEEWVEVLNTTLTTGVNRIDLVAPEGKMLKKVHIHIDTGSGGLTTASKVIIKGSKSGNFNGNNGENLVSTQATINTYSNTVFFIEKGSLFPLAFSSTGTPNGTVTSIVYMGGVTQLLSTNTETKYRNAGPWKTICIQPQTANVYFNTGTKIQAWGVYE